MSLFIKNIFLVQLCLILAILYPTSLANLVVEVGTRHSHQTLFWLVSDRTYNPSLQWRHNGHDGVSHHRCLDCLLNRLFRHRSKKISKLRVTDLCAGNPPVTGGFPSQRASNAENVSIWWRYHVTGWLQSPCTYLSLPPHRLRHRTLDKNPNGAFCGMEHLAHSTHCRCEIVFWPPW